MKTFKNFLKERSPFYNPNISRLPQKEMPLASEKIPYGSAQRNDAARELYGQSQEGTPESRAEREKQVDNPIRSGQKSPFIHPASPEAKHFENPSELTAKNAEHGFGPDNREDRI